LTGGLSWSLFQQKIGISLNAGVQENDDEQKVVRGIYSIAVNYGAERFNSSVNYSNFSTSTRQSQIQRDIFSDTLEYFQVTRNASLMLAYSLGNSEKPTSLNFTASAQDATDNNASASQFFSFSLGAQKPLADQLQVRLAGTLNENISKNSRNRSAGPVLNVSNAFVKGKLRSAFSAAMLNAYNNDKLQSKVYNASLTNTMKILKKHSVAFNLYYLVNETEAEGQNDFNELRAMLNYNFSF
jgi:hypothetical protein